MNTSVTHLLGLNRDAFRTWVAEQGEPAWRADQVMRWVYGQGELDFDAMTNLSKRMREGLKANASLELPRIVSDHRSIDGTRKWMLAVDGGQAIETVFIPEAKRGTLCISSQAGCALDCSFCSTGKQGFNRNLTAAEIVGQVVLATKMLAEAGDGDRITNVVFMGMGEPLANFAEVLPALQIFLDDHGFGLSKRRVTVSTSGLVPFIDRLGDACDTALAVSLHAPNDDLRNQLVPINRKYPLRDLLDACQRYTRGKDRRAHVIYEYVMLDGVNDQLSHARQLVQLLGQMPAKVNLIPFNPFPGTDYRRSPDDVIRRFELKLREQGLFTTTRRTRGDDITAACGQLVGDVVSKQSRRLGEIPVKSVN